MLPLDIFPPGGLASSVITTVWVGVVVITFFNLRFGTTLSGLVVPGYLIPLFIIKPTSAWVIVIESVVTYGLARLVADRWLVRAGLGELFGRDRFFLLILISILVRVIFDAFLLPALADYLTTIGAPWEVRSSLHSFGLIIIALCANMFWNGGLKIGGYTLATYLLATWLVIAWILIPLTNFNISTLGYMYEDVASSVLASPKAYIILITAAFFASRLNLRYGWDFNGILIPSLLALQWYSPIKIVTTFVEAFVIYFAAQAVMRLPLFRQANIEGARQMLLFFSVGYVYKLILGYIIITWLPEHKVTDYYGFGYLLGTLMAMKMYDKGIAIRLSRVTLQTSLLATLVASTLGFALTLYSPNPYNADQSSDEQQILLSTEESLQQVIGKLRSESYRSNDAEHHVPLQPFESGEFSRLFRELGQFHHDPQAQQLQPLASGFAQLGYRALLVEERYLVLYEADPTLGRGIYVVNLTSPGNLAIGVPRALEEVDAASVAHRLFLDLDARYLAFTGARAKRSREGSDDVLLNSQSLFQVFHRAVALEHSLQLRSQDGKRNSEFFADEPMPDNAEPPAYGWVKRAVPDDLSLTRLKALLGTVRFRWSRPNWENRLRDASRGGFVELFIGSENILNLYRAANLDARVGKEVTPVSRKGRLESTLAELKQFIAPKFSDRYQRADNFDLIYFAQAVLNPLLALADTWGEHGAQDRQLRHLDQISSLAHQYGYRIYHFEEPTSDTHHLLLTERQDADQRRYWGSYIIRLGPSASSYLVEVPMPLGESATFETGGELYQLLSARALLIAGAHPMSNPDGSARVTASGNRDSLFNLVHQRLVHHYADSNPHVVQVRGYSAEPGATEVVIAPFRYQKPWSSEHPSQLKLEQTLRSAGYDVRLQTSDFTTDERRAKLNAQSRYLRFINSAQYSELWLPSSARQAYQYLAPDSTLMKKFLALGIEPRTLDLRTWLARALSGRAPQYQQRAIHTSLSAFLAGENIEQLYQLQQLVAPAPIELLTDQESALQVLTIASPQGQLLVAVNLNTSDNHVLTAAGSDAAQRFVNGNYRWLWGSN